MKQITQKALSLLLSFAMLFGMVQGAAVPAFAEIANSVIIGGVTVDSADWYAVTDGNGVVSTAGANADNWRIHVQTSGTTANVTLNNANINNPNGGYNAIEVSGYNLNILLEGVVNRIGLDPDNSDKYAIYNSTGGSVSITGTGNLLILGNYGIYVNGSGNVGIDIEGELYVRSKMQMVSTSGILTAKATSIDMEGYYIQCDNGSASFNATGGDVVIKGTGNYGIKAYSNAMVSAMNGKVSVTGSQYAVSGNTAVSISAKNDITLQGTVRGVKVYLGSETGDVTVDGCYQAIATGTNGVTLSAPQGDITLTSDNLDSLISGAGSYDLAITAGGKFDARGPGGIMGYSKADIKADTVTVALTGNGYAFSQGALTITNPAGGNCKEVSISGGGGNKDAIIATDVTIKADKVTIAAAVDAKYAINAVGNVTVGDTGMIIGAVFVAGTKAIDARIMQIASGGDVSTIGLDLSTAPTEATYYKAGNGYALFTPASGGTPATLVLHGATISSAAYNTLYLGAETMIKLEGANSLTNTGTESGVGIGNYSGGRQDTVIQGGSGDSLIVSAWQCTDVRNLTISGGNVTANGSAYGIVTTGDMLIENGAQVSATKDAEGYALNVGNSDYGSPHNLTISGASSLTTGEANLTGSLSIGSGATVTVQEGSNFYADATKTITNNGTIVNNGTFTLPYSYTAAQVRALNLSGSILLYDSDNDKYKAYVNGSFCAYGGVITSDLNLSAPLTEATYYKAGNGYFIFTPGTSAALTLHNVDNEPNIVLPSAPITLYLEGTNKANNIEASGAVTVSGSGTLDAYFIRNSDASAALTVNSGAKLNTRYQTTDSNNVTTKTYYGNYTDDNYYGIPVSTNSKLVLTPGAVLTLAGEGFLEFEKNTPLNYLIIGAGASIVNNTHVTLPQGTTAEQIAALPLSGTGMVRVAKTYYASGVAETWDNYTNDGVAMKTVSGGLTLTAGGDSGKTVKNDGYAWDGSTLTLGSAYIDGSLTLPTAATVTINTAASSSISGGIGGDGNAALKLAFTGTAPLTINGNINDGINHDTVTVKDGAQVAMNGFISIGGSGTDGTLNVTGSGTKLTVSSPHGYAVMCDTVNVSGGASLTAKAEGSGSMGVEALAGGVNVTGGSTLTTGCDYGIYIIDGKLTVDGTSKLITNGAVAPFCIVDTTSAKAQSAVLALPGVPTGTEIASVAGSLAKYWSLAPTNGNLSVSNESNTPVTLTGAVAKSLSFVKPANPTDNSGKNSAPSLPSVLTDASTNVTVDLSGVSFPSGVTGVALSVTRVAPRSAADPRGATLYPASEADAKLNVIGTSAVYNIRLLDRSGNAITGFTGTVKVKIPLPAGLRGTPRVFRNEESAGTFTDMKAAVGSGFLTFSTDHFSYYVIAGTGDSIILDTKNYQMPVNGGYQIGVKLTGSKAASVKFRSTNDKTATVTRLKNGNYQVTGKNPGTVYIMFDVYDNKNKFLTHASIRVDVKAGVRPKGDSTRQYGLF